MTDQPLAPHDVLIETQTAHGPRFSMALDLAELLGVETNAQAEDLLRAALAARQLPLRDLSFDTESAAVWLVSRHAADITRVRKLIGELAAACASGVTCPPTVAADAPWTEAELAQFAADDGSLSQRPHDPAGYDRSFEPDDS